jgi:hypothetical protein
MSALRAFKKEQQIKKQYEKLYKLEMEYRKLKATLNSGEVFEIDGKLFTVIVEDKACVKAVSYIPLILKG